MNTAYGCSILSGVLLKNKCGLKRATKHVQILMCNETIVDFLEN